MADDRQRLFNESSKSLKLDLVLFQDALTHMVRSDEMSPMYLTCDIPSP